MKIIKKIKQKIIATISKPFQNEKDKDYPQTWNFMPRNWFLRKFLQVLCGILGGHEISETEFGYSGGKNVFCNCRWCDKEMILNKFKIVFKYPQLQILVKLWDRIPKENKL